MNNLTGPILLNSSGVEWEFIIVLMKRIHFYLQTVLNVLYCVAHLCIISCVRLWSSALVVVKHVTSFIVMFQGCNESSSTWDQISQRCGTWHIKSHDLDGDDNE